VRDGLLVLMYKGGTRQRDGSASAAPSIARHAEAWTWQLSARCRGADTAMFFHPDGERGLSRRQREREAKQLCAQCSVVVQCRDHSLTFREPYGVWGGLTEDERLRMFEGTSST
jgi:WhiB family transcriptional regulator, redox-sensing transcriptional regulator